MVMKLATDILKSEHDVIKSALQVLQVVCARLESSEEVKVTHLSQLLGFFRVYADLYHHCKEEEHLFVQMQHAGIPAEGKAISSMLAEHERAREYVHRLVVAETAYRDGKKGAAVEFVSLGRRYRKLMLQHINFEDNIAFKLANKRLSSAQQRQLLLTFEETERKATSRIRHKKMLATLAKLSSLYQ